MFDNLFQFDNINWVIAQSFALVGLIITAICLQCKSRLRLLILRTIAMVLITIGVCFLKNPSAIILCSFTVASLLFGIFLRQLQNGKFKLNDKAIYLNDKQYLYWRLLGTILMGIAVIVLNIIFWRDSLFIIWGILGIIYTLVNLFVYTEKSAKRIRFAFLIAVTIGIIYYFSIKAPINGLNQIVNFVAAVIGIIRNDIKKPKQKQPTNDETSSVVKLS